MAQPKRAFGSRRYGIDSRPWHSQFQLLEERLAPAVLTALAENLIEHGAMVVANGSPAVTGLTPTQIRTAYGVASLPCNGAGQTIAIVDAYDNPKFVNSTDPSFSTSDLALFDAQFGLPNPPSFLKVNQNGSTSNLPGTDPAGAGAAGNWEQEEALDVEWAHALAPAANIVLIECNQANSAADLLPGVVTANNIAGVSVVSMSWGETETSMLGTSQSETGDDSDFLHAGITYLAATGDAGSPGLYPAYSPNVVAVGGTFLTLNGDNSYNSEVAWHGSGGGTSSAETQPAYQNGFQSTGARTIPDVAFDASPTSGAAVYDSYNGGSSPWVKLGGTSLSAPCWAGLVALADQARAGQGAAPLSGISQTLPALYALPAADFHDITTGMNGGFSAGVGYDEVTGRGTPIANLLVPDLAGYQVASKLVVTTQPPGSVTAGGGFNIVVKVEDRIGDVISGYNGTVTLSLANNPGGGALGGTSLTTSVIGGVATFSGLSINRAGTGYTIQAASTSLTSATTNAFNVVPGAAKQLVVSTPPPASVSAGSQFGLTVAAADSFGNVNTGFTGNVVISLAANPGNSTLGGTLTLHASGGLATFSGLTINHVGSPYTLQVTSTGLSAANQNITVSGLQLLPDAQNPLLNDLVWAGTSGDDHVQFQQASGTSVRVTTLEQNGVLTNSVQTLIGVTGRVVAEGAGGNDVLDASGLTTTQATLDGGAGNNTIYGGQAGDILIGGSNGGEGRQGNNTIIAGNGNNAIYGNAPVGAEGATGGNNLIVGGSGNDTIYGAFGTVKNLANGQTSNGGEGGQNILVGGGGSDAIYASQQANGAEGGHGSILIAGTTSLNQAALTAVMNEWTSADSYATKIADISGTGSGGANGTNYLKPGVTVFNDHSADQLFGDTAGSLNWMLYTLAQDVASRTKAGETLTNTP